MRHDVSFYSEGCKIAAFLYLPENIPHPVPAVILCQGFAGVKELLLPAYAEYFCKNGYAVLNFDYRGFGGSEGESGRLVPDNQIRDIRNAITYIQTRSEVDPSRIALWGSSFGGANAIVTAAKDKRVKCLCVQLTFGDGSRVITGSLSDEDKSKFVDTIRKMQQKKVCTNKEMMVSIHKVLSDEQSKAFYNAKVSDFPALQIKIPFLTVAETMEYKPEEYISGLDIPIHIVSAGKDGVNPPGESLHLYNAAKEPKALYTVDNATHYEVYEGDLFLQVAEEQLKWFRKYL